MRKMKDSGIAWIGEIPAEWNCGRISELYTERKQKVSDVDFPPLSVTMKGVLPQLSTAAKTDAHEDRKLVRKGDFAINSRSDRRGSCGISPYDGSVSLINIILKPRGEMHPVYYEWLFHSTMFSNEFYKWGHGIVNDLWTTNWQDMKKISVPVPPYQEQHRIAAFLDEKCAHIDAVIEKTRASIDEYKKLKQAVITRAVTKGIRQGRKMKDSGIAWIGEIPEEWKTCYVSRLVKNTQNGLTRRELEKSDGNIVLKLKNITKDGNIDYEFQNRIQLTDKEKDIYGLEDGDFLFVRVNGSKDLVGKNAIFKGIGETVAFNDHIIRVKIDDKICDLYYFHWYLMSNYGKSQIELHTATAAGQYTISSEGIKNIRMLIPELSEQQEIASYLDAKTAAIDRLIAKKEQLAAEMESCKKSLIYEVVTGKREVPA